MKRILIFVHYNQYGELASYILYTLKQMRPFFSKLVFISNSPLNSIDINSVELFSDKIIFRENRGYDFAAWREALENEGWDNLSGYDSVTLMNDTCFCPIFDIKPVFNTMEQDGIDFWGLTNHKKTILGMPKTNRSIPEHLQSYFLSFSRKVVASLVFQKFWKKVKIFHDKNNIIIYYETQLTKLLLNSGFFYKAYIDLIGEKCKNSAIFRPDILIEKQSPFIKIKSFSYFKHPQYLIKLISSRTDYPIELIDNHLTQIFVPNISNQMLNKNLIIKSDDSVKCNFKFRIALHIHAYYVDILEKYLILLKNISVKIDLYITTDNNDKKNQIIKLIKKYSCEEKLINLIVVSNRGRDVLPWLKLSDKLKNYDIAGHFHTKKTLETESWLGSFWLSHIMESIFIPINQIMKIFEENNNIGIVVPDIPPCFNINNRFWNDNKKLFKKLWNKMNMKKSINPNLLAVPIMPFGTMFWYRPNALKPLFDLNLSSKDFPKEPIHNDGSLAHIIESLPVYIAWSEGYDFRIAINQDNVINTFCFIEKGKDRGKYFFLKKILPPYIVKHLIILKNEKITKIIEKMRL